MSKIVIQITADSPREAHEALVALAGTVPMSTVDAVLDLIETPPEPAEAPAAPEPAEAPATPSLDEAIDALRDYGRAKGAVALKGVLDQLGVRRATEIQPNQINDLIAAINGAAG